MDISEKLKTELEARFLIFAEENNISLDDIDNNSSFIGGFKTAIDILTSESVLTDITDRMHNHARDVDEYCYGLPLNGSDISEYRNIIHISINNLESAEVKEDTIPVTYGFIKATCGWSAYCDVTGDNHYAVKEFGIRDNEIFDVKLSHAKQLKFV